MELPSAVREIFPFQSRWMDIQGHRVHYIDEGAKDGPPVVLLHGNPTWSFLYRDIIPKIGSVCRARAAASGGIGLSQKPAAGRWYAS